VTLPPGGGIPIGLHAPLGRVDARIDVDVDGAREIVPLEWELARDPYHAEVGDGETMFVATGRGRVRVRDADEKLAIDMRSVDQLDDFLDDAFWRLHDPAGAEVAHGFVYRGETHVDVDARGDHELVVTVVARGRRFLGAGMARLLSCELVRRPRKGKPPAIFGDVYAGIPGEGATRKVELGAGERVDLYLRDQGLDEGYLHRGRIRFLDDQSERPLAVIEWSCDRRVVPADAASARSLAEKRLRDDLDQALWQRDTAAVRAAVTGLDSLGIVLSDLEHAEIETLIGDETSRTAALAELAELAEAEAASDEPDRKRQWRIAALRAVGRMISGKLDEHCAERAREASRRGAEGELAQLAELAGARAKGEHDAAARLAAKLLTKRPHDPQMVRWAIECDLAAGLRRRARGLADGWLDRFPGDRDGARAVEALVEAAPTGDADDQL
jgi:hypothetical protein